MPGGSRLKAAVIERFPRVYPIVDTARLDGSAASSVELAKALASAGARIAQYRHKGAFTRARFEEAAAVAAVFRRAGVCFVINDRADIALALGADGVHVGQQDLPPATARRLVGEGMLLGYSTHGPEQLADAACEPADYLAIGPVFGTTSKPDPDPVVGLDGVAAARSLTGKPLVAIGGIKLEAVPGVLEAGADCVSMISGVSASNAAAWMQFEA